MPIPANRHLRPLFGILLYCCAHAFAPATRALNEERGPDLFQQCNACHSLREGGSHRYGPNLHGLMDRGIAMAPDFDYSEALKHEDGNWTRKRLNAFLAKPHLAVPGTSMPFRGMMNPHDRADLLDWLIKATADTDVAREADDPGFGLDAGDKGRGEILFRACRACHSYDHGAPHSVGPNLYGVMGRNIGSVEGFEFSADLAGQDNVWTPARLNLFFKQRLQFKQGTHTAYIELRTPRDRADLIAYLGTLKD